MPSLPLLSTELPHLEARFRERLWRGDRLVAPTNSMASGFEALDAQLPGGGWPARSINELLLPAPGIGEMRLLAPCLAELSRTKRKIIVFASAKAEQELFYPDGWAQLGIDPAAVLLVQTERPADRLWAIEQSLKSAAFGALLAWLPEARADALRRLQLAAASGAGLSFLLRPSQAQQESSPAPLRLLLARTTASQAPDLGPHRLLSVRLLKRRGPVLEQPLLLRVSDPRPLRMPAPFEYGAANRPIRAVPARAPVRDISTPLAVSSTSLRHALGRPALPDTTPRSHPTPAA